MLQQLCGLVAVAVILQRVTSVAVVAVTASNIPVAALAEVVSAAHRHFSTSCVFLIRHEVQTSTSYREWTWHRGSSLLHTELSVGSGPQINSTAATFLLLL
jgi:hypothetical protein